MYAVQYRIYVCGMCVCVYIPGLWSRMKKGPTPTPTPEITKCPTPTPTPSIPMAPTPTPDSDSDSLVFNKISISLGCHKSKLAS